MDTSSVCVHVLLVVSILEGHKNHTKSEIQFPESIDYRVLTIHKPPSP